MQVETEKFIGRHSARLKRTHSSSYTYLLMMTRGSASTMDSHSMNGYLLCSKDFLDNDMYREDTR